MKKPNETVKGIRCWIDFITSQMYVNNYKGINEMVFVPSQLVCLFPAFPPLPDFQHFQ